MRIIEIDQETYDFLQSKAIPYVDKTPADTIKRLIGIPDTPLESRNGDSLIQNNHSSNKTYLPQSGNKTKERKVSLVELVKAGLLQNGQKLFFQDYRGNHYPEYHVVLSNGALVWENQPYSMSNLAKILLKQNNYSSESVRGPLFWSTHEGKTVFNLWDEYLKGK